MSLRVIALLAVVSVVPVPGAFDAPRSGIEAQRCVGARAIAVVLPGSAPAEELGHFPARLRRPVSPARSAEADRAPLPIARITHEPSGGGPTAARPLKLLPAAAAGVPDGAGGAVVAQWAGTDATGKGTLSNEPGVAGRPAIWRQPPGIV